MFSLGTLTEITRGQMARSALQSLQAHLDARFSDAPQASDSFDANGLLETMAARGSCRAFLKQPVTTETLEILSAIALASPTKSDLQQRDIVFLTSKASRQKLAKLVAGQAWVADAPVIAVFCGNNRRQRLMHDWHNVSFENDHLDAFFNAAVDAGIALSAFVTAAEAQGLGCCPISAVRNEAEAVSELLELPDFVFPVVGLAIGHPIDGPTISKRIPLKQTVHIDTFCETDLRDAVASYDADRAASHPYTHQRFEDQFGTSDAYGWSEDKVRQYSQPERADFGAFVRAKGFSLK